MIKIYNTEIVSIYRPRKNTKIVKYISEIGEMECPCSEYYEGNIQKMLMLLTMRLVK